ncbi:MAG: thioredoxin family protein [Anaeroplasmataceae bacterium]|nr:thioredoxin family protein [Anaeroplasmataceae bacterium]
MIYEYNGSNLADGLYYFYASWNSRCNILADRLLKLNLDFKNLTIYKVNTTKYSQMKKDFNVVKMPSYLLIKNQQVISRKDGNLDYFSLKKWLSERME